MYVPTTPKVNTYDWPAPDLVAELVKLEPLLERTLCVPPAHVHVAVPPTASVSVAGFAIPLRTLAKKTSPTLTATVAGAAPWPLTTSAAESVRTPDDRTM